MRNIMKNTKKPFNMKNFLMLAAFPLLLEGCNTMEGAGADIKHAGQALEQSAERNKEASPPCPCCSPRTHSRKN